MTSHCIALFDLDGTLADYDGRMRRDMETLQVPGEPDFPVHGPDAPDYFWARQDLIKAQPGWWLRLSKLSLGFDILKLADELGFEIQVLTKGPHNTPSAWMEKVEWCRENIGESVKVTVTEEKSLVCGSVLVDDCPEYVSAWLKRHRSGAGVVPAQPINDGYSHPRAVRYDGANLPLVRGMLEALRR